MDGSDTSSTLTSLSSDELDEHNIWNPDFWALLGTRVRGEPAIDKWRSRTQYGARPFKSTSGGTIAIKVAVQIGTVAAIAFALQSVICCAYLPHGGPRAGQDNRRGLHNSRLLLRSSKHEGPNNDCWHGGCICQVTSTAAYTLSRQRSLACCRFPRLGTIASRWGAVAHTVVYKLAPLSAWLVTHDCRLVGHRVNVLLELAQCRLPDLLM